MSARVRVNIKAYVPDDVPPKVEAVFARYGFDAEVNALMAADAPDPKTVKLAACERAVSARSCDGDGR